MFPSIRESEWSQSLPKYCKYCGAKLVAKNKKQEQEFDSRTGEPIHKAEYYLRCSKRRFWLLSSGMHDDLLIVENPEMMIGEKRYRGVLTLMRML